MLREHLLAGRISMEEFEERIGTAYSAVTIGALERLTNDLPGPPEPPGESEARATKSGSAVALLSPSRYSLSAVGLPSECC